MRKASCSYLTSRQSPGIRGGAFGRGSGGRDSGQTHAQISTTQKMRQRTIAWAMPRAAEASSSSVSKSRGSVSSTSGRIGTCCSSCMTFPPQHPLSEPEAAPSNHRQFNIQFAGGRYRTCPPRRYHGIPIPVPDLSFKLADDPKPRFSAGPLVGETGCER